MEYTPSDIIIFCGSILLFALLVMELLDWICVVSANSTSGWICPFVYGEDNGPNHWRLLYHECHGSEQSPINIVENHATIITSSEPLRWHNYSQEPFSMILVNDGNKVTLLGIWDSSTRPKIDGGPLKGCYNFWSVEFRWGPGEDEGSEHTIEYMHYPMEMQVVHTRMKDAPSLEVKQRILIVSYFFELTVCDNPYLDHLVKNLWRVTKPGSRVSIPTFPLEWLLPSFECKYYTYCGSLTQPPCTENVTWIINPEPIAISSPQISQFHKICSADGCRIISNTRPVQKLNDRQIFYYI